MYDAKKKVLLSQKCEIILKCVDEKRLTSEAYAFDKEGPSTILHLLRRYKA